jgi:putative N6-adenine-specific DNA methylase
MELFIMCGQGLESLLAEELVLLGVTEVASAYCGVHVGRATMNDVYTINYRSRIASRVLLPLLHFRCIDRNSLYEKALSIDWGRMIKKDLSLPSTPMLIILIFAIAFSRHRL